MLLSLGERTDVPIVRPLAVMAGSAPSLSPGLAVFTITIASEPGIQGSATEQSLRPAMRQTQSPLPVTVFQRLGLSRDGGVCEENLVYGESWDRNPIS